MRTGGPARWIELTNSGVCGCNEHCISNEGYSYVRWTRELLWKLGKWNEADRCHRWRTLPANNNENVRHLRQRSASIHLPSSHLLLHLLAEGRCGSRTELKLAGRPLVLLGFLALQVLHGGGQWSRFRCLGFEHGRRWFGRWRWRLNVLRCFRLRL